MFGNTCLNFASDFQDISTIFHYAVSQFELISVQEWDSSRFRTYLQELVQACKSGSSTDILLCFDVHGLESSRCVTSEEAGVQSHVCVMLDLNSTEGDDDWGVRLLDPAPTRKRVWTCRGETLMSAMQVSVAVHDPKSLRTSLFGSARVGPECGDDSARAAQGPPAEACCGIWILRAGGQARPARAPPQRAGHLDGDAVADPVPRAPQCAPTRAGWCAAAGPFWPRARRQLTQTVAPRSCEATRRRGARGRLGRRGPAAWRRTRQCC